jgi:cystathionine beta-synthase
MKGYGCVVAMPDKNSGEKATVLNALGAEIVWTPASADIDSPESHFSVAQRIADERPNAVVLQQFR